MGRAARKISSLAKDLKVFDKLRGPAYREVSSPDRRFSNRSWLIFLVRHLRDNSGKLSVSGSGRDNRDSPLIRRSRSGHWSTSIRSVNSQEQRPNAFAVHFDRLTHICFTSRVGCERTR